MKRGDRLFIEDILESIKNIEFFSNGLTKEGLTNDLIRQFAIMRALEIIGEAAKNISLEFKEKYPKVPWREIIGTRDIITHGYFKIDIEIVWKVIKDDIFSLKKNILDIKDKEEWNNTY